MAGRRIDELNAGLQQFRSERSAISSRRGSPFPTAAEFSRSR
jgi:hypothetical protein